MRRIFLASLFCFFPAAPALAAAKSITLYLDGAMVEQEAAAIR